MPGDKPQKKRERPQGGRGGGDGGGDKGGDKANKKTKYYQQSKGGTGQAVPIGSHGILVTCDAGREDKAGDEAVALIEEHYDKLTDPTAASAVPEATEAEKAKDTKAEKEGAEEGGDKADVGATDGGGGSKDIAALLAAEVAELKETKGRGGRFRVHNTGVKGCIYVLFPPPSETKPGAPGPAEVARSIAQEAQDKKQVRGRHIVRFLPVTAACFAGLEEIKAAAPKLVAPHFPDAEDSTPVEFAVEYEHRSAEGFDRLDVINAFTTVIKTPPHKVNLKAPSKVVLVQLIRNGCAMAVVAGYKELAKFNVRKLAEVEEA